MKAIGFVLASPTDARSDGDLGNLEAKGRRTEP